MRHQGPVGLLAQKAPIRRRDDQQPAVGQVVDAHREGLDAGDHLAVARRIDGDDLVAPQSENHSRPSCHRGDSGKARSASRTCRSLQLSMLILCSHVAPGVAFAPAVAVVACATYWRGRPEAPRCSRPELDQGRAV